MLDEHVNIKKVESFDKQMTYDFDTKTLVGTQKKKLQDLETGEVIEINQITKRIYGSKNFWKCYLMDFMAILGIIDSKQLDVLIYILEHTKQSDNLFIGTQEKICKDTNISRPTVSRLMKKLQETNFITKVQNGVWMINPKIMVRGNDRKQHMLINYYESNEPVAEDKSDT